MCDGRRLQQGAVARAWGRIERPGGAAICLSTAHVGNPGAAIRGGGGRDRQQSVDSFEGAPLGELTMPQREFDITIGPDGSVELHVSGYKGKGCLEVAKLFEKIVGELKSE